jgi:hypothetical protein
VNIAELLADVTSAGGMGVLYLRDPLTPESQRSLAHEGHRFWYRLHVDNPAMSAILAHARPGPQIPLIAVCHVEQGLVAYVNPWYEVRGEKLANLLCEAFSADRRLAQGKIPEGTMSDVTVRT